MNKKKDFSDWYTHLIKEASLAEYSSTRGCMVIKPYGFAIWEKMQAMLDSSFKKLGHQNAYFPLLIPISHFSREAQHVDGFAKECALVTHYRLKKQGNKLIIDSHAQLQEPLVIRPTSETIIWEHFSQWIQSHRDLPLLINQWANVVRWEMRTRPFLRTSEFLWQEGHTAHATAKEAQHHALKMLDNYVDFIEKKMAIPVVVGEKTLHERFAGAEVTYTLEGLMQDGKALQIGTSHFLGQNFAKAFNVQFTDAQGKRDYVWGTSWGVTTRLLGALVMVHADKQGLVLPPAIAPIQVVIIPIYTKGCDTHAILAQAMQVQDSLEKAAISVKLDQQNTHHPGWKFNEYERRGVPLRIAIGPKDVTNHVVTFKRRDTNEQCQVPRDDVVKTAQAWLADIQRTLYKKACAFKQENTHYVEDFQTFKEIMEKQKGFIMAHWDGTTATELAIKEATKATIRCIPHNSKAETGHCVYSGKPSKQRVLFGQAY